MTTTITSSAPVSFNYRKLRPFSKAEFRFKLALGQHAGERLLPRLHARARNIGALNQYSGVNARVAEAIFLEAIMTNVTEWGGFGFDFARLSPAQSGLYNLAIRQPDDWKRADRDPVNSASEYFITRMFCPRAADWIPIARGKTFQECVEILAQQIEFL